MTCDFFKPLILEYLDNELESEQVRQFENHLGQCPHCSKQTDEFRSLLGLVIPPSVSYPSADIWNGFSADIVSQVETSMIKPDQNFTNSWAKISSIGWRVAACLLLAIGTLIYYTINQDSKSKRNITAQLDGPRKMLRLPRQTTSPLIPEINIVIQEIENALGKKIQKNMMPLQAGDVPETYANVDDLVRDLDYKPSTSVQKGIDNFVAWYREFFKV